MRRQRAWVMALLAAGLLLVGCGKVGGGEITVISREAGSGTRDAFVKLLGIEQTDPQGRGVDAVIDTAEITNSTGVMLTAVADNRAAVGYVSLGALNPAVKALSIDGVEIGPETLRDGSYPVKRSFYMVIGGALSEPARDFLAFILSPAGQRIVEEAGYVGSFFAAPYSGGAVSGKITVSGSSSAAPVLEGLAEAYMALHSGAEIVVQSSDTATGIRDAAGGLSDLGMASRKLTDREVAAGLTALPFAADGIAVIVHPENPLGALTARQVRDIYMGNITRWAQLGEAEGERSAV